MAPWHTPAESGQAGVSTSVQGWLPRWWHKYHKRVHTTEMAFKPDKQPQQAVQKRMM